MSHTILLYGATGYSGRLIAAEAAHAGMTNSSAVPGFRMVLAGRDGREVAKVAREHGMEARVFGIEDRRDVIGELGDIDVVINAAGPFALTATHLARAALAAGCHYVDINGEAEVYMKIDDLSRHAEQRNLALVSAAGHRAAASDLLIDAALGDLRAALGDDHVSELGAIRIAVSRMVALSRGSLETLWRSLREQVRVVRTGDVADLQGRVHKEHVLWHEPIGRLEHTFDFFDPRNDDSSTGLRRATPAGGKRNLRIASAANLVDTLTARLTVERNGFLAHRIESYVEVGSADRLAYQFGPLLAPLAATPWARNFARLQLNALPAGPTPQERVNETLFIVLEIEDPLRRRIVHWGWHTPNPYDFTARVVVEVAKTVPTLADGGWRTPADVLQAGKADLTADSGYLRGCELHERSSPMRKAAS